LREPPACPTLLVLVQLTVVQPAKSPPLLLPVVPRSLLVEAVLPLPQHLQAVSLLLLVRVLVMEDQHAHTRPQRNLLLGPPPYANLAPVAPLPLSVVLAKTVTPLLVQLRHAGLRQQRLALLL